MATDSGFKHIRFAVASIVVGITLAGIVVYTLDFNTPSGTTTITQAPSIAKTETAPSGTATIVQSQTTTVTYTANAPVPIPSGCSLAKTVSSQGYRLEVYFPGAVKAGDNVCMLVVVYNVNHTGSPELSGAWVTVADVNGNVVDQTGCLLTHGGTFPVGTQYSCGTGWNTALPSKNGVIPRPGTYHLSVDVSFPGYDLIGDIDVTLSG